MTTALVRHAWLQKHPSPAAGGGEFHWYSVVPPPAATGDRELRAHLVERARGLEPPAILWELAPERVVWAQPFSAIAPLDGRRYVGLVVTVVEAPATTAADLLATLVVPPARPWMRDELPSPTYDIAARLEIEPLARALIAGGTLRIADPTHPSLAMQLAELERLLPARTTSSVRRGAFLAGTPAEPDRVAALLVAAWRDPRSPYARAFRVLCDLAGARDQMLDEVAALDPDAVLTDEERAVLAAPPRDLPDLLHSWGRGRFDLCPTAGSLTERLADAVALRAFAQLAGGNDGHRAIAEARWHSLLPAARRTSLLAAVASRATSLRSLVEAVHG
jgi:hypothetical protein